MLLMDAGADVAARDSDDLTPEDHAPSDQVLALSKYRVTSLTRKRTPLGPYRRPVPRVLGGS